ncbi:MAG: hypothetical protein LUE10_04525 [Alistipes sp.]|nr:hypothetical protein [Alistipes sp.]
MPCLMAMEEIKPLKKDMEKNDVVTIYIAGDSSPEPAWIGKLPGLGGIHYRLDADQWRTICNKYEIKAIPQYMVFDKEGNKTCQTVGFPGTPKIRAQLKKVW